MALEYCGEKKKCIFIPDKERKDEELQEKNLGSSSSFFVVYAFMISYSAPAKAGFKSKCLRYEPTVLSFPCQF